MTYAADCRIVLDGVARLYHASGATAGGCGLTLAAQALETAAAIGTPAPLCLPVCRYLDAALVSARNGPLRDIAAGFGAIAGRCTWVQNSNYVAQPPSASFLDRYGYVELVGPGRQISRADVRVGFLMLGPETDYPAHMHPAAEVYHVVSGDADWWHEGGDWHVERSGAAIHHPPHLPHATRTAGAPLLALYCWFGDIETEARLV